MAKGRQRHQERMEALAALGRGLARRARSTCELCEATGVPLGPWEVPPLPEEPEEERTVLACGRCRAGLDGGRLEPQEWRFLEGSVWSPVPAAQVAAARLLRRLAAAGEGWATDVLDGLVLEPDLEEWLDAG